jgi:hypothetical protein
MVVFGMNTYRMEYSVLITTWVTRVFHALKIYFMKESNRPIKKGIRDVGGREQSEYKTGLFETCSH